MIKNRKIIVIVTAIALLSAFLIYTMVSAGIFFNKGTRVTAEGSKTYISPGKLLYSYGSNDGAWVVYLKTGQTIISYMDKHGNKQWQNVYTQPKFQVDSSKDYTIIGETDSKEVAILNTDGEIVTDWDTSGNVLLCSINDEGLNAVVSDGKAGSEGNWTTNLTVSQLLIGENSSNNSKTKIKEIFSKEYDSTEFIEVRMWNDGVVALVYKVSNDDKGQYLMVINNDGDEIYSVKVDEAVSDIAISPNRKILTWSANNIVYLYNTDSQELKEINHKGVISCGFISDTKMYAISNQTGLIPFGRRVHVREFDLNGKTILKANFPGYVVNDQVLDADTLTVTTNKGVYAIKGSKGVWHALSDKDIFTSAIDNNTIFIITKDDTLVWYQKP